MSYSAKFASCLYGPFRFVFFDASSSVPLSLSSSINSLSISLLARFAEKQPAQHPPSETENATNSLPTLEVSLGELSFVPFPSLPSSFFPPPVPSLQT